MTLATSKPSKKTVCKKVPMMKKNKHQHSAKKAPGAPKRFRPSFILFYMNFHKSMRETTFTDDGKMHAINVSKEATAKWKTLSPSQRIFWDNQAEEEKNRYYKEKAVYEGLWKLENGPNRQKRWKDPSAPKRNPSSFLIFSKTRRPEIRAENPSLANIEVSRILGAEWNKKSPEEKRPFQEQEEAKRAIYLSQMEQWRIVQKQREAALKPYNDVHSDLTNDGSEIDHTATDIFENHVNHNKNVNITPIQFPGELPELPELPIDSIDGTCTGTMITTRNDTNDNSCAQEDILLQKVTHAINEGSKYASISDVVSITSEKTSIEDFMDDIMLFDVEDCNVFDDLREKHQSPMDIDIEPINISIEQNQHGTHFTAPPMTWSPQKRKPCVTNIVPLPSFLVGGNNSEQHP